MASLLLPEWDASSLQGNYPPSAVIATYPFIHIRVNRVKFLDNMTTETRLDRPTFYMVFSSLSSAIVWMRVTLKRTVDGDIDRHFDNLSGSHLQSLGWHTIHLTLKMTAALVGCGNTSQCQQQQFFPELQSPR